MRFLPNKILAAIILLLLAAPLFAEKKYDPGASDSEIKIGNFTPQTGWLKQYGVIAKAQDAYFRMINDNGGINGRKIVFVFRDDGSDPKNAVDIAHDLIEKDHVLLLFGCQGLTANLALRPYLNDKKIPQLFVASPLSDFNDPAHFPFTMGFQTSAKLEASIYARYLLQTKPDAKIAVLYADDPTGKDYLKGLHQTLGKEHAAMIGKELAYKDIDASPDAQIAALKDSGADTLFNFSAGKFTTQAIRKVADLDWHPLQFIPNTSISVSAFLDPAGLDKAAGIISSARSKAWLTAQSHRDPGVQAFLKWMKKYNPDATLRDANYVYGYETAEALTAVLKKCGDDLTRENIMKQAAHLDLELSMLRPQIKLTTSPTDYRPIKKLYLMKFSGQHWLPFGEPVSE